MDIQKLTIGQMAELNRVTRQTLRHYDMEELLKPYDTDPETGYRYYHVNQSARLDMIQYLKFCGMSLDQIKEQLQCADTNEIQHFLTQQLGFIDQSILKLNQSRRAILRAIENYDRYKLLPQNPEVFHERLPARKIYTHTSQINFFNQEESGYEMMLRELKQSLLDRNLPVGYFCNVGTIIRKEYLARRELCSNEVFVFLEDDFTGIEQPEVLPGGQYVCICSDDFYQEADLALRLLDYINEQGYTIIGDYICEVIADLPFFDKSPRNMVYKIQIPTL